MSPKDIAEKIINFDKIMYESNIDVGLNHNPPDTVTLARAYLELENNHIAAIALINKNISTLRMWTNPNSYLGSELLDLSNVNSKFLADNFTFQNSYLDLKSEITKLKEENEKLKQLFAVQIDLVEYGKKLEEEINKPKEHKKHKDFVICKYVANNHSNYLKTVFRNDYISHINYGMECLCEDKCYYNKELKK